MKLQRDAMALQRVRQAAEQAKKELSSATSTQVNLPFIAQGSAGPLHMDITLTRAEFDRLTAHLIERTTGPVQSALNDAGIAASELGCVLLVGGSTRIPAVQNHVRALTGKEPSSSINPDECVATGAAIQGETLSSSSSGIVQANSLLLLDVTPLSLGVATRLVERNTTLPVHYSQIFSTAAPFQTSVEIKVLQGERPMAADNKAIGTFRLKGIKRAPAGVPKIEVTFDIDTNGILTVSAKDLDSGREQSIVIDDSDRMSDEEIERAIQDAKDYAEEDEFRRATMEVRQKANDLLLEVDAALKAGGKQVDKHEKRQIRADMAELQRVLARRPGKKEKADPEAEARNIVVAAAKLDQSSANVRQQFGSGEAANTEGGSVN